MSVSLSSKERLTVVSNLGTLLTAGIPLLESVDSLLKDARGNTKRVLGQLREDIIQGKTIADSFSRFPNAFDPVTVNLIRAAEEAGNLETTLKDITSAIKKEIEFSDKVRGALTYPAFVVVVFSGILFVILTFVIPRIAMVFSRLKVTLPLPTRILIEFSKFFTSNMPYILVALFIFVVGAIILYSRYKRVFLNVVFSLPGLSGLAREIDLVRFTRSFSLLLASGLPITQSLELCETVVAKAEIAQVIRHARDLVTAGKSVSKGLAAYERIIPAIMIRITEAGEKSGSLERSMQDLSEYFEAQVDNKLKTLTALLEPVMLVIVGVLIGGMMLSIIAPIYQLIGTIHPR